MALWTPAELPSLVAWYDPSDVTTVTLNGGNVSQLNDKSGNGNHWSQEVAISQPFYDVTINGLNAIRLANGDGLFTAQSFNFTRHTMLSVFQPEDQTTDFIGTNGTSSGHAFSMVFQLRHRSHFWAGNGLRAVDSPVGSIQVGGVYVAGQSNSPETNLTGHLDGTWYNTTAGTAVTLTFPLGNGRYLGGDARNRNLGEVVFSDTRLSDDDIQKIEGYLAHKWGTAASLPTDHPYKSAAPTVGGGGPTPVTGTGSDTITLDGTATGTVPVAPISGSGSDTLSLDGAGAGVVAITGVGDDTLDLDGSGAAGGGLTGIGSDTISLDGFGAATVNIDGAGDDSLTLDGDGSGIVSIQGQASDTIDLDGSGSAGGGVTGQASDTISLDGSGTIVTSITGAADDSLTLDGSGAGEVGLLPGQGSGSDTIDLGGSGEGVVIIAGEATDAISLDGSAEGQTRITGEATDTIALDGAGTAGQILTGQASDTIGLDGAASGEVAFTPREGQASDTIDLDGAGIGSTAITGQAIDTITLDGVAAGLPTGIVTPAKRTVYVKMLPRVVKAVA